MNRPRTYTIAAILQILFSAFGVVASLPSLAEGARQVDQAAEGPPYIIIVMGVLAGTLGLVSAYGVWRNQKWGLILTLVLSVINCLSALPGILFAPTVGVRLLALTGVVIPIIIICLLLWPKTKRTPLSHTSM